MKLDSMCKAEQSESRTYPRHACGLVTAVLVALEGSSQTPGTEYGLWRMRWV